MENEKSQIVVYEVDSDSYFVNVALKNVSDITDADILIPPKNGLFKPYWNGTEWIEHMSNDEILKLMGADLETVKHNKISQINIACKEYVIAGFKSVIDDVEYTFSLDMEAQSNFNTAAVAFTSGIINDVGWTAYINGNRKRLTLTQNTFLNVYKDAMKHRDDSVKKYSILYDNVMLCETVDDVNNITWD